MDISRTVKLHKLGEDYARYPQLVYDALMITCSKCGHEDVRGTVIFTSTGSVEYCRIHVPRAFNSNPDTAKNPFDNFTLDNVRDERGQKVTVNSISELRAAEKRYNFALAVATDDGGKADKPPQHDKDAGQLHKYYKKKFCRDESAYGPDKVAEAVKASGCARNREGTLVDFPNPI